MSEGALCCAGCGLAFSVGCICEPDPALLVYTRAELVGYGERVKREIAERFDASGRASERWAHEVVTGTTLPEPP